MSGIITAFNATIGWLVDKGRDKAAEKLKDGDVIDQQFRGIIMREIDDLKSKLDGLSRKDLLASISFFREGIELLYDVFDETRLTSEYGANTAQVACAEAVSALTENMQNLELTESATKKLVNAKKRFERARERAIDAFSNEALSTSDRVLAMQYRVMATVLETIDNPAEAVTPCKVCIEELNGLPAVQQHFKVQFQTGFGAVMGLVNQEERTKVISGVCCVNRVVLDVKQAICGKWLLLPKLPTVNTEKGKEVDLLRTRKVAEVLRKQNMEQCSVLWILGEDGGEQERLKRPRCIATNSSGQYLIVDDELSIKMFDNSGKFVKSFRLPTLFDEDGKVIRICSFSGALQLATDIKDNLYVLFLERMRLHWGILKVYKTADQHQTFFLREMGTLSVNVRLSVSDRGKVIVLWREVSMCAIEVYETHGESVCRLGEQIIRRATDVTAVSDGRIMVVEESPFDCVHIFSEHGDHLSKFDLQGSYFDRRIAFHRESQHVVLASITAEEEFFHIQIYTKDGESARGTVIRDKNIKWLRGIAVSTEGRIAVIIYFKDDTSKVIII